MSTLPTVLVVGGGAKALAALHALQPFIDPDSGPIVQVAWVTNTEGGSEDLEISSHVEGPLLESFMNVGAAASPAVAAGAGGGGESAFASSPGPDVDAASLAAPHVALSSAECKLLAPLGVFHRRVVRIVQPQDVQYSIYYSCSLFPHHIGSSSRPTSAATAPTAASKKMTQPAASGATTIDQQLLPMDKMKPIALLSDGSTIPFDRLVSAGELSDFLPPAVNLDEGAVEDKTPVMVPGFGDVTQHVPGPRWDSLNKPMYQGAKEKTGGVLTPRGSMAIPQVNSQKQTEVFHLLDTYDQESLVAWLATVSPVEFEAPKKRKGNAHQHQVAATLMSAFITSPQDGSILAGGGVEAGYFDMLNTIQEDSSDDADDADDVHGSSEDDSEEDADSEEDGQESEEELPLLQRAHQVHVVVGAGSSGESPTLLEVGPEENVENATAAAAAVPAAVSEYLQASNGGAGGSGSAYCWSFVHALRFPATPSTLRLALGTDVTPKEAAISGEASEGTNDASSALPGDNFAPLSDEEGQPREEEEEGEAAKEVHTKRVMSAEHAAAIMQLIRAHHHKTIPSAIHVGSQVKASSMARVPLTILSLNITTVDLSSMGRDVTLKNIKHLVNTFLWKDGEGEDEKDERSAVEEDVEKDSEKEEETKVPTTPGGPVRSMLRALILDNVKVMGANKSEGLSVLVTGMLKQAQYHRECIRQCSSSKSRAIAEVSSASSNYGDGVTTEFLPGIVSLSLQNCDLRDVSALTKFFSQQGTGLVAKSAPAPSPTALAGGSAPHPVAPPHTSSPNGSIQLSLTSLNISHNPLATTYEMTEICGRKRKRHTVWAIKFDSFDELIAVFPQGMRDLRFADIGLHPPPNYDPSSVSLLTSKTVAKQIQALSEKIGALVVSTSKAERMLEVLDISGNALLNNTTSLAIGQALLSATRSHIHTLEMQNCKALTARGIGFLLKCVTHLDDGQLRAVMLKGSGAAGVKEVPLAATLLHKSTHLERFSLSIDYAEQLGAAILVDQIVSGNPHKILVGLFDMAKCVEMMQLAAFGQGGNMYPPAECRPLVQVDLDFPHVDPSMKQHQQQQGNDPKSSFLSSMRNSNTGSPRASPPPRASRVTSPTLGSPTSTFSPKGSSSFRGASSGSGGKPAPLRKEAILPPEVLVALEAHLNKNRAYVAKLAQERAVKEPLSQPDHCYDIVGHLFMSHEHLRATENPHLGRLQSPVGAGGGAETDRQNRPRHNSSALGLTPSMLGFSGMVAEGNRMASMSLAARAQGPLGGGPPPDGRSHTDPPTTAEATGAEAPVLTAAQSRAQSGLQSTAIQWTLHDEFELALKKSVGGSPLVMPEFYAYRHQLLVAGLEKAAETGGLIDLSCPTHEASYGMCRRIAQEVAQCWMAEGESALRNADVVIRMDLQKATWETPLVRGGGPKQQKMDDQPTSSSSPTRAGRPNSAHGVDRPSGYYQHRLCASPFQSIQVRCFPFLCLEIEATVRTLVQDLCPVVQPGYHPAPVSYQTQCITAIRPLVQWGLELAQDEVHSQLCIARRPDPDDAIPHDQVTPAAVPLYSMSGSQNAPPKDPSVNYPHISLYHAGLQKLRVSKFAEKRHQLQQLLTWTYVTPISPELEQALGSPSEDEVITMGDALQREYYASHRLGDIAELILQHLDLNRPAAFAGQDNADMPRDVFQTHVLDKVLGDRTQHVAQLIEHWAQLEAVSTASAAAAAAAIPVPTNNKKKGGKGIAKDGAADGGKDGGAKEGKDGGRAKGATSPPPRDSGADVSKKGKKDTSLDADSAWLTPSQEPMTSLMISMDSSAPIGNSFTGNSFALAPGGGAGGGAPGSAQGNPLSPYVNPMVGLMHRDSILSELASVAPPGGVAAPSGSPTPLNQLRRGPDDTWSSIAETLHLATTEFGLLPKPAL